MAGLPPCMMEDSNGAIFTGTFFETGQTVTVCATCLQDFMETMLTSMTNVPVHDVIASLLATIEDEPESTEPPSEIAYDVVTHDVDDEITPEEIAEIERRQGEIHGDGYADELVDDDDDDSTVTTD